MKIRDFQTDSSVLTHQRKEVHAHCVSMEVKMENDMTVQCGDGYINIRAGAIIIKNGMLLMIGNERDNYCYSVGGRLRFGETAEEAVIREVFEETGVRMEPDRLGFVHENYFLSDVPAKINKPIYEISFYFYMKVPEVFAPVCESFAEGDSKEFLKWIPIDGEQKYFPEFFRTELLNPVRYVKHFVTDERQKPKSQ